eukprot:TRINITY_DN80_c0_g1_i1.p1 TRINITY_DN80_c0_g1~~TRINITY_DN80_c0_g1_i1.p1  ORF type:complete len:218 (+),score=50.31 TRINITY_DN80_c0_g1_i1:132-785(+)
MNTSTQQTLTNPYPDFNSPKEVKSSSLAVDGFKSGVKRMLMMTSDVLKDERSVADNPADTKSVQSLKNGRWTKEECKRFEEALKRFGRNWKKVEDYVGTRSGTQVRSHAQKYFLKHKDTHPHPKGSNAPHPADQKAGVQSCFNPLHEENRAIGTRRGELKAEESCSYLMEYMRSFGVSSFEDVCGKYVKLGDWVNTSILPAPVRTRRNIFPIFYGIC